MINLPHPVMYVISKTVDGVDKYLVDVYRSMLIFTSKEEAVSFAISKNIDMTKLYIKELLDKEIRV